MVIDSHGHVTAPDSLYVYKAQILAHRGAHGRGGNLAERRRRQEGAELAGLRRQLAPASS